MKLLDLSLPALDDICSQFMHFMTLSSAYPTASWAMREDVEIEKIGSSMAKKCLYCNYTSLTCIVTNYLHTL